MHTAGGALVAGLGGGSAAGGAAGAGVSAALAGDLNRLADQYSNGGGIDPGLTAGNIGANLIAGGIGGLIGGNSGAFAAGNADMYNRQLHPQEKTLAKELAEKSGGKYTEQQIEDQMRLMGGTFDSGRESSAAATLIGQTPSDSGAQWQYAGKTDDGKPILTQSLPQANTELQNYIVANAGSVPSGDVPNMVYDQTGKKGTSHDITGPFTKFDKSDGDYMRSTVADAASMASTNAGRIAAGAATAAALPTPYAPAYEAIAFGSTVTGWATDFVAQMARPNPGAYVAGGIVDLTLGGVANKYPLSGTVITEFGNWIKSTTTFNDVSGRLNSGAQNKK